MVLDQDNVYRLKTFKKELSITPKVLKSIINLENNLTVQNQTEFAKKKRNLINALWTFLCTTNIYNYLL